MGAASIPEVKRPGRGVDNPPPSSADFIQRVELYLCSVFVACYRVKYAFNKYFKVFFDRVKKNDIERRSGHFKVTEDFTKVE
jgi:hypothetical protein